MNERTDDRTGPSRGSGWSELAGGRWEAARAAFESALAEEETAQSLEGLSWAAWWLDDAETVFDARERAFRIYRRRGDQAAGARMAIWLAADHLDFRGSAAVAHGWIRRAARLLDRLEPGPEHGWLAFHEGYLAFAGGDPERGSELAVRSAELGRRFDVPDLEMLGLAMQGAALVACAQVARGMELLDEATAAALSGEATVPISSAWTFCFLVSACEQVRDYPRAFEWCEQIAAFARRYRSRYMLGFCRAHYASIHLSAGRWPEAEAELTEAVDAYSVSRPTLVPSALAGLAELRRRQGRWADSERLLEEAGAGDATLLCRARLALDRGEALRAAELGERCLRQMAEHDRLDRAPALELLIRARAARGDLSGAGTALEELRALERSVGTPLLRGAVAMSAGVVAAASGDHEVARRRLEDATDLFERTGAPFEAAQAGLELAASLAALGRVESAEREARTCLDRLTAMGAQAEARRARNLLDAWTAPVAAGARLGRLTRREREVLRLVAAGLTNRQVAERLCVSEHTVHRHVTNLLRKLDLPSRTAAAAHAARAGLLDGSET